MKLRIFGFDLVVEFSFILMLAFGILSGARDLNKLLLFSILHECGHIIALLACQGKIERLTLSFYGLALKYDSSLNRVGELIVIACGPAVNFILYLIFGDGINLLLFILNILPIYPLDGGRIMRLLFPRLSIYISAYFLVCVFALSVYLIFEYKSFSLLLISCYLIVYGILY